MLEIKKASVVVVWLLPVVASFLAFVTNGVTQNLSRLYLQSLLASLLILLALAALERALPSAGPRKSAAQVVLNIQVGILLWLGITLFGALAGFVASVVGRRLGTGWIDLTFRPGDHALSLVATFLLTWLLTDFFSYWYHRSQHTFAFLWQVHKCHHMDEQVSVTTRYRDNLSDAFIAPLLISIPMSLFFRFDPVATAKLSVFAKLTTEVMSIFIHSNIRMHLGWAGAVVVGPQFHRIHHSRLIQHHNRNYCVFFPIWDILFGTYHHPSHGEFPPTGVAEAGDVSSIREVLAIPFRGWWALFCGWRQSMTSGSMLG